MKYVNVFWYFLLLFSTTVCADPILSQRVPVQLKPFVGSEQLAEDPGAIPYSYPQKETLEIDTALLGSCLALATKKIPHFNIERTLDDGAQIDGNEFSNYLEGNHLRKFDFSTPFVSDLRSWVLSQADKSIDPVSLYQQAMILSHGNIWTAMLSIHQLIRNEARWWTPSRYRYDSSSGNQHTFFDKLIDIRGDLRERGGSFAGDHAGSWYRIWGVYLYQLRHLDSSAIAEMTKKQMGACYIDLDRASVMPLVSDSPIRDAFRYIALGLIEWQKDGFLPNGDGVLDKDSRKVEINQGALSTINAMLYHLRNHADGATAEECASRAYLQRPKKLWMPDRVFD